MSIPVFMAELVELCVQHGTRTAVISPGSRSAILAVAFARHPQIKSIPVMDERSAGYIALGIAQQSNRPVALVCTSGTAANNLSPAISEAFFLQIPLIVLTADRPKEWIHQQDDQTIYQDGLYERNVKASFTFPDTVNFKDAQWYANRLVNDALITCKRAPSGPVHINIPVREPFYPIPEELFLRKHPVRKIDFLDTSDDLDSESWRNLIETWDQADRIIIAGGQYPFNEDLSQALGLLSEEFYIPVLGDALTNLSDNELFIRKFDLFLRQDPDLRPDLLITFGKSFVSKTFKQFIRKNGPKEHWHIGASSHIIDSLQSLNTLIPMKPDHFFRKLFDDLDYRDFVVQEPESERLAEYHTTWLTHDRSTFKREKAYLNNLSSLNDLTVINFFLNILTESTLIHVANSMPVRYVSWMARTSSLLKVYSNRGTSGIDGCVGTAVGAAIAAKEPVFLIVGDVALLYDRNSLYINDLPPNFKIIVLNNAGGNIFSIIDGPGELPELEKFFTTKHDYTFRRTAEDVNMTYFSLRSWGEIDTVMKNFMSAAGPAMLEAFTDGHENKLAYTNLLSQVRLPHSSQ